MKVTLGLVLILDTASCFLHPSTFIARPTTIISSDTSTCLFMGTNRRSRRNTKKEQRNSRPNSFYDAIQEAGNEVPGATPVGTKSKKKGKAGKDKPEEPKGNVVSGGSISDAAASFDARPDVSTIVVDEETGIERIQQGQNVMDVVTRKAVKFSTLGPEYRLAQMFPGVPPDVREKHRMDWKTVEVPEMVQKLREASLISVKDEETGEETMATPPHPEVSDNAIDFVLANRDLLGPNMKKTLGRLKLRAQSQMKTEEAIQNRRLWKHFMTLESSISAPFRQMLLDAEGKVGPNFGNLDLKSFCSGELYERTACYLVLKGMVAHWEKKVRDAEYVEATPETQNNFIDLLMTGDPKRYLPDPPIIFRYNECIRITLMAQNMTSQFANTPELYDDLPPEVRFVESASFIKGGTALREFMINDFCPAEGITPEALREGLRRLDVQMSCMQIDPYGDLKNVIGRLCDAIAVGTDDARDVYGPYLSSFDSNGPGYFQTYTFNHDTKSMVKFLDAAKDIEQGTLGPTENVLDQMSNEAMNLFSFGQQDIPKELKVVDKDYVYETPDDRKCGRPHDLGWLDLLGDEEMTGGSLVQEEEGFYESDNWRERIQERQSTPTQ